MASLLKLVRRYPLTSATAFASTRGFLGDAMAQKLEHDDGRGDFAFDGARSATYVAWGCAQGRTRVIQRRFNVSVPRARVTRKAPTRRGRSER